MAWFGEAPKSQDAIAIVLSLEKGNGGGFGKRDIRRIEIIELGECLDVGEDGKIFKLLSKITFIPHIYEGLIYSQNYASARD